MIPINNSQAFGQLLKSARSKMNLTQSQVANHLCISRQAYSNYEQGRCLPSPDTLAYLSIFLDTNLFYPFLLYNERISIEHNNMFFYIRILTDTKSWCFHHYYH